MDGETAAGARERAERWQRIWGHREVLLRVARRRSASPEDAEDAVHEAMVRAMEQPALDDERLGGWLTTVTMRLCVDRHRQVAREAEVHRRALRGLPGYVTVEDRVCDRAEAHWLTRRVREELPGRQAEALGLRAQGLELGQIAQRMGLSYRAVQSLLARARKTLRGVLAGTLGTLAVLLWPWRGSRATGVGGGVPAGAAPLAAAAVTLTVAGLALLAPGAAGPEPGSPEPGRPVPGVPVPGRPVPGVPEPGSPEPGRPVPGTPGPGSSLVRTLPVPGTPGPGSSLVRTLPVPGTPGPGTSLARTLPVPGTPEGAAAPAGDSGAGLPNGGAPPVPGGAGAGGPGVPGAPRLPGVPGLPEVAVPALPELDVPAAGDAASAASAEVTGTSPLPATEKTAEKIMNPRDATSHLSP